MNAFRKRHALALNDSLTQMLELARQMGLRQMGTVAIDATRIKASADKVVKQRYLKVRAMRRPRGELLEDRLKVRRWQQVCAADDPNENAGGCVDAPLEPVQQMPKTLDKLPRPARKKTVRRSVTDPYARSLHARGPRFVLGYTDEIGVSDDHLIVAQRVTQEANDNASLGPMVDLIEPSAGSSHTDSVGRFG